MNAKLLEAQSAYYAGEPILSDAEYDTLESQLRSLIASNPEFANAATVLSKVGDTKNSDVRIKHDRVMLSIENHYTKESFLDAAKTYGPIVLEEPKRDGISCELSYKFGHLVRAVTRGDGESGEEMTEQVKACGAIPQFLIGEGLPNDLRIRGELVMRRSELARINALGTRTYANTRNLTAGTMKQQDLKIVASREIILCPWDMYSPDEDHLLSDSAWDRMMLAERLGFPKYEGIKVTQSDILSGLDQMLLVIKDADIVSDGVVIKTDSHKLRHQLEAEEAEKEQRRKK
jgi:DNA ligase (NAD+)